MCVQHIAIKKTFYNSSILYLIAIALAIYSGLSDITILKDTGLLISDIFIKIFKCISLPIIALSIIVTMSSYSTEGKIKKIWQRSILYTLGTTIIAASVSFILYLVINPKNVNLVSNIPADSVNEQVSYSKHLINLIP